MKKPRLRFEILIALLFIAVGLYPGHRFAVSARASGRSVHEILGLPDFSLNVTRNNESGWTVTDSERMSAEHQSDSLPDTAQTPEDTGTTTGSSFALNDQKNILIIGVKLDERGFSSLEGLWLAIQVPSSPRVLFIPVYPTGTNQLTDNERGTPLDLAALYGSHRQLAPPKEFLVALEQAEIWWSYYLVVDQSILRELNNLAGANSEAALTWMDPNKYTTLEEQFTFALSICQNLDSVLAHKDRFAEYLLKMHGHYASNIDPARLVDVFTSIFRYGDSLACEFPTLSLAALK